MKGHGHHHHTNNHGGHGTAPEAPLNENQLRVQFRPPHAKDIVSCHSGSILSSPEPIVDLSPEMNNALSNTFNQHLAHQNSSFVQKEDIAKLLVESGLLRKDMLVDCIVSKRYAGPQEVSLDKFLEFAKEIQAPTYHYGNRLRRCVNRGEVNEVAELIVRGCNPNCADGEGLTPLHYACEYGKMDILQCLMDKAHDTIAIDCKDKYGWTPLFVAVHHGNHSCVKFLIRRGCKVNAANDLGKIHCKVVDSKVICVCVCVCVCVCGCVCVCCKARIEYCLRAEQRIYL
jgi:ankyrin repeat protein